MIFGLGNRQKMKEDIFLSNLGTVALHAAKVPTDVFSSTLICILRKNNKMKRASWDSNLPAICYESCT